jgi:hypothetical protein
VTLDDDVESWLKLLPVLNEAQVRWYAAQKVIGLGRGGLKRVHELTGISHTTLLKGIRELRDKEPLTLADGVRHSGAGRKRRETEDPTLLHDLEQLLKENTAGDPMTPLMWTSKSTRTLSKDLLKHGHKVSPRTVDRLLNDLDYSQQGNRKNKEGMSPPERDDQFRYINTTVRKFGETGDPVLSIDCKKREQVGNFRNAGKTWRKKGDPREVNVYDFPRLAVGNAIPYGVYDVKRNDGLVNVGVSHETSEFAVESIRQWWQRVGRSRYTGAKRLLLCADGGSSNGSHRRAWKVELQQLADQTGLAVSVCHYPPGTSKWNKIEHRMFSFISMNWRGEPLVSYETVVNLIGHTTTTGGLRIKARLDTRNYRTGRIVSDAEMRTVRLQSRTNRPVWNYTILPHTHVA